MNENSDKNLTKPLDPVAASETNIPGTPIKKKDQEQLEKQITGLEEQLKKESRREKLEQQEIEDRISNRELREKYAKIMFWYMCIWSFIVILILICSGLQCFDFQLNTWVLVTLIGSTTVSVFSIVKAIIAGIFKSN